jgi:multidrug resistance efflux pump
LTAAVFFRSQAQLASDEGQLIETDAALRELQSEKAKTVSQFIADNENKLAEASRKRDEARQALAKATARLARTRLNAPIDGVVQQTAVTTVGQVVTTGQQLAVITPSGGKLQVEALVPNLDIGFVKLGQPAVVKVDAFPPGDRRRPPDLASGEARRNQAPGVQRRSEAAHRLEPLPRTTRHSRRRSCRSRRRRSRPGLGGAS